MFPPPLSEHRSVISTPEDIRRNIERGFPSQEITPEVIEYYIAWDDLFKSSLCQILQNKFAEMDALIDVTDDGPFL